MKFRVFRVHKWKRNIFYVLLFGFLVWLGVNYWILKSSEDFLYTKIDQLPKSQVALVLGSYVFPNGALSYIVLDRMDTAIALYQAGKVDKLLLSGDHGQVEYDEVNAMKAYALKQGIRPEDIFLDHAGFDTYDSAYRARDIFGVESVVVVTQEFHLPRAVYIARSLGLDAVGIKADRRDYAFSRYNDFRESLARMKAFLNVVFHSKPKYLGQKIPITGDGRQSWD